MHAFRHSNNCSEYFKKYNLISHLKAYLLLYWPISLVTYSICDAGVVRSYQLLTLAGGAHWALELKEVALRTKEQNQIILDHLSLSIIMMFHGQGWNKLGMVLQGFLNVFLMDFLMFSLGFL